MADLDKTDAPVGSTPRPDPTVLTTEQLQREVGTLKELLQQRINELEKRLEERFSSAKEFAATLMEEREKQTRGVLDEQRRAMGVAEQEREKSAQALRVELSRQIEQGDMSLRDHIMGQVEQIKLLAQSMDEQSRLRVEAVANERRIVTEAQQDAIAKAERASEKQFDEFSKTVEAQITALREAVQDLTRRFDKLS